MTAARRLLGPLLLGTLLVGALLAALYLGAVPPGHLYARLLKPLFTLTLAIAVGLLAGMVIETAGLAARLGSLAAPLLRLGHLRQPSALAFTAGFLSAVSASTILMNSYQDGAISRRELTGASDIGTGALGVVGNVIWFLFAGVWLAIGHVGCAIANFVTIIGIPFGWQHLKLAGIALAPIGRTVVTKEVAAAARQHNSAAGVAGMRKV